MMTSAHCELAQLNPTTAIPRTQHLLRGRCLSKCPALHAPTSLLLRHQLLSPRPKWRPRPKLPPSQRLPSRRLKSQPLLLLLHVDALGTSPRG